MDEATKKMIADAVAEATDGLKSKNKELLGKLKSASDTLANFEGVDIEALKTASTELENLRNDKKKKDGEYKALYDEVTAKTAKEIADRDALIAKLNDNITATTKKSTLATALGKVDVIPDMLDIALTVLESKVNIVDNVATIDGTPVETFIGDWVKTDTGKNFVKNGNAGGGGGGSDHSTVNEAKFFDKKSEHYSVTEQSKLANRDPVKFELLNKQFNKGSAK